LTKRARYEAYGVAATTTAAGISSALPPLGLSKWVENCIGF
jgi:hypothetical protein